MAKQITEQEKQIRIRIARNLYQRQWRRKNKSKYQEIIDNFWLKKYSELVENKDETANHEKNR